MNERTFVLKGTICYSNSLTELSITENGYLVCEDGRCAGVFDELPEKFAGISCTDFGDELIIPGLTDLHLHAPQYTFRASGMDLELLDWLNTYTFPQEARYEDAEFAKEAYSIFTEDMKKSPNTRACIFGTLHVPATDDVVGLGHQIAGDGGADFSRSDDQNPHFSSLITQSKGLLFCFADLADFDS